MDEFSTSLPLNALHAALSCNVGALESIASVERYHFGQTIYFQDQRADYWYRIVSGAARECTLTSDGRRQIVDFMLPGDLFGFCHRCARGLAGEILVESTTLACYPRRRAEELAESDPLVARRVREMAFGAIERLQARTVLLGRNSALEKVSAFLLEMAARSLALPGAPICLPMTRYDIADYLALAVETVSRSLTTLRRQRAIALLGSRRVQIIDRGLLLRLAASTTSVAADGRTTRGGLGPLRSTTVDTRQRVPSR
jgi:CRP-like cAMP-binding protein